jgi:hypothetical protein
VPATQRPDQEVQLPLGAIRRSEQLRLEDEQREYRARSGGGHERCMISDAQITLEPDHVHGCVPRSVGLIARQSSVGFRRHTEMVSAVANVTHRM